MNHRSQPFARAIAMMGLISAAMSLPASAQQAALAQIGPYVSRGKGKGGSNRNAPGSHKAHVRAQAKARNIRRHRASAH